MSKKRKKSGNSAKQAKASLKDQAPEALVSRAEAALLAGKPRDALELLKVIVKKDGHSDAVRGLMFRAYLLRGQQLRSKKMDPEADAVFRQALAYTPPGGRMDEGDLVLYRRPTWTAQSPPTPITWPRTRRLPGRKGNWSTALSFRKNGDTSNSSTPQRRSAGMPVPFPMRSP